MTASATYIFSPKYAITASSAYDFGTSQACRTRCRSRAWGTDLTVTAGVTYNAIVNNFGFTLEVLPRLLTDSNRYHPSAAFGSSTLGR